jgi:hypothetical protein
MCQRSHHMWRIHTWKCSSQRMTRQETQLLPSLIFWKKYRMHINDQVLQSTIRGVPRGDAQDALFWCGSGSGSKSWCGWSGSGSRSRGGGGRGGRSAKNVHPPWQNPRYAPVDHHIVLRIRDVNSRS